jgi:hypothetical protein
MDTSLFSSHLQASLNEWFSLAEFIIVRTFMLWLLVKHIRQVAHKKKKASGGEARRPVLLP